AEEAIAMRRRDQELRLRVINDEESSELSSSQPRAGSVDGLKIILRASPQLEQFPAAKAAFIRAAQKWESLIQTPITMVIEVDFGPPRSGEPFPSNFIGASDSQELIYENIYPTLRAAMIARSSSAQESALYNSLPQSQVPTDIGATAHIWAPMAVFRA